MPEVIDNVAVAKLYGEPLFAMPHDLYIPPDALEVFLEAFQGPLDLLLYLIRKQNFNILDIPMAALTRQYLSYVDEIRSRNLELAAEYLLMAAKAGAVMRGSLVVNSNDVREAALPVLRHRMFTSFAADSEGVDVDQIIQKILKEVPEPGEKDYQS